MLTLDLSDFMIELDGGTVKHVGAKTNGATVKLYHVTESEVRPFGDQTKLVFDDGEGNHVEVVLDEEQVAAVSSAIADDDETTADESSGADDHE